MSKLLNEEQKGKIADFLKDIPLNKEGHYEVDKEDYKKLEELFGVKPIDGFTGMVYEGNAILLK